MLNVSQTIAPGGATVTMLPNHAALREPLSFPVELLHKFFKMGDHVKVIGGARHVGETGLVVRVGRGAEREAGGLRDATASVLGPVFPFLSGLIPNPGGSAEGRLKSAAASCFGESGLNACGAASTIS